jgi:hypothetical protein
MLAPLAAKYQSKIHNEYTTIDEYKNGVKLTSAVYYVHLRLYMSVKQSDRTCSAPILSGVVT